MVTVREVLQLAIETDMMQLAHRVFWAMENEKVEATEDATKLSQITYDEEEIAAIVAQNTLAIGKVKLYVVETKTAEVFAFYYGEKALDVHALHQKMFKESPKRLRNADHLLGEIFHFNDTYTAEFLYFHRAKVVAFPYYIGHASAGSQVFYDLYRRHGTTEQIIL